LQQHGAAMTRDSVVMPAVRIPRKLWKALEEIMRRRMFSGKAELIRDALREYVLLQGERTEPKPRISEGAITLQEGRSEDQKREEELIKWLRKIRA
jgi:metal-responsive CopG/Arc/MetJ family transcriptional regulator